MSFLSTDLCIIVLSIATAYVFLQLFVVFPSWRKLKAQQARASLAKCFRVLNDGPFQSGTITNGHYLHDRFYTTLYGVLMTDNLKILSTRKVPHTQAEEEKRKMFRKEIEALDPEMQAIVNRAVWAMGSLIFLQNMINFPSYVAKSIHAKQLYDRKYRDEQMMRSGEYLTVTSSADTLRENACPA